MPVRCPHCQNPIELVDDSSPDRVTCTGCNATFVRSRETIVFGAGDGSATLTFVPEKSTPSDAATNGTIGDYEIVDEIARGGMGVVYKARQRSLNRIVALKMILGGQFVGDEQVQRFRTEAEAAANLDHSGIVSVYEVGEHDGQHFLAMAFVDGETLSAQLVDGPLAPKEAASLIKTVAEAIQFAHDSGVVHRDLKPDNIILDRRGQPRVTDFGLAKNVADESGMTATGQVMGTPSYMPPEQALGHINEVGPLADVYSLGATLYRLLTGRPPFQAASAVETIRHVVEREPATLQTLNPSVPRDLETICLKCLRKEPGKRYQTAEELAADLGRWLDGKPIQARPVGRAERAHGCLLKSKVKGSRMKLK